MAKISCVIPCYNQGEYLAQAIESAYSQTYPPHEIIVVIDGATDNSQEIAETYKFSKYPLIESPVKVIVQVNKGLPSARNTGIMNATGDYIQMLDADDFLEEYALEKLNNEIMATGADVIAPSFRCFGKTNQDIILGAFTMEDMKKANRLGYFSCFRRSALIEVGGYNPKMKYGWEDYDLWFDLLKRGKGIVILQEILVNYRTKEHSMLTDANAHADELWVQLKKNHPEIWK